MAESPETWLTVQLMLVDLLSDSWRWWAAAGSILALRPVLTWLITFIRTRGAIEHFGTSTRFALALALFFGLLANIFAGAVIPFATDDRLSWLTAGSPLVLLALAAAWLCWGMLGWAVAIAFATSRRRMAAASVILWLACYVATGVTMGAQL